MGQRIIFDDMGLKHGESVSIHLSLAYVDMLTGM